MTTKKVSKKKTTKPKPQEVRAWALTRDKGAYTIIEFTLVGDRVTSVTSSDANVQGVQLQKLEDAILEQVRQYD